VETSDDVDMAARVRKLRTITVGCWIALAGLMATAACGSPLTVMTAARAAADGSDQSPLPRTSSPRGLTPGPDGNVWFGSGVVNRPIGRISPQGVITTFRPEGTYIDPAALMVGPDDNIWFLSGLGNQTGYVTPQGEIRIIDAPTGPSESLRPGFSSFANGPDGNVWVTNIVNGRIGRVSPSGAVTTFTVPGGVSDSVFRGPTEITAGGDGNLWFAAGAGFGAIGRVTPNGDISTFPRGDSYPCREPANPNCGRIVELTDGPDGNVWFVTDWQDQIRRITPDGETAAFQSPDVRGPRDLIRGPDGNLWFTSLPNRIGRITPEGNVNTFAAPRGTVENPSDLTVGPDGNLWFTSRNTKRIGRMTLDGSFTTFRTQFGGPDDLAAGPDGNLWFTTQFSNRIGRITPAGEITYF